MFDVKDGETKEYEVEGRTIRVSSVNGRVRISGDTDGLFGGESKAERRRREREERDIELYETMRELSKYPARRQTKAEWRREQRHKKLWNLALWLPIPIIFVGIPLIIYLIGYLASK